eukprot:COSAG06_NODE_3052_length_5915_cov_4.348006_2_plen_568_part_00
MLICPSIEMQTHDEQIRTDGRDGSRAARLVGHAGGEKQVSAASRSPGSSSRRMAPPARSLQQASAERRHCAPPHLELRCEGATTTSGGTGKELKRGADRDGTELADLQPLRRPANMPGAESAKKHTVTSDHYAAEIIHFAAQDGLLEVVESQLDAGVDASLATQARGWTPLHYAAYNGRVAVVELLLGRGAAPECRSLSNRTPLNLALLGGHDEVATQLADAVCKAARANPRWVRSWEATSCMRCTAAFSLLAPKHHCRYCGCTVCGACSTGRLVLDRWLAPRKPHEIRETVSETPQRVCDGCHRCYAQELPASCAEGGGSGGGGGDVDTAGLPSATDLQLLRALATWNPKLCGWASLEAADGTVLLELQPAPDGRGYEEWDCANGRGFGRVYKVVSDARLRTDIELTSELVGVLRAGEIFTSLETRIPPGAKARVSVPLTNPSVLADKGALGSSYSAELAHEYVKAHSAYCAADESKHSLTVGELLVVTENMKNGWSKGFKITDPTHTQLLFPISHTRPVALKLPTPEPDSQEEDEEENSDDDSTTTDEDEDDGIIIMPDDTPAQQ